MIQWLPCPASPGKGVLHFNIRDERRLDWIRNGPRLHESSLAQAALELAVRSAEQHGASRISRVRLAIGDLAQADGDTVAFWFGILAEGGPAAGAEVLVEHVGATAYCGACAREFAVAPPRWGLRCPDCGGNAELRSGRELAVVSIDVED